VVSDTANLAHTPLQGACLLVNIMHDPRATASVFWLEFPIMLHGSKYSYKHCNRSYKCSRPKRIL